MNLAILCKKGQKGIKETDGMPQKGNSSFLNRLFHNMKECGILSKKEALIYWLCGLSPFCACDIICPNPRCNDQTHYTPPPPLEHRRQMPAMILFRQNKNPSPAKPGRDFVYWKKLHARVGISRSRLRFLPSASGRAPAVRP